MKEYTVGICDSEIRFASDLMDHINYGSNMKADASMSVKAVAFSSMQAVHDYLSVSDLDLLLTDDMSGCEFTDEGYQIMGITVIRLTENRYDSDNSPSSPEIYKYQNVSVIEERILHSLKPRLYTVLPYCSACVYSPLGRCGKTNFAKALTAVSDNGRNLYVGMEEFSGVEELCPSDVLYLLVTNSENFREEIHRRIVSESGISSLYASGAYLDIRSVFRSDMERFLSAIMSLEMYNGYIFDFGSAVLEDMSILDIYEVIYMPILKDAVSKRKIENFYKILKVQGLRRIRRKIVEVEPPDAEWFSPAMKGYAEEVMRNVRRAG